MADDTKFPDYKLDGYEFARRNDELGYTTHFKTMSDGTIAEIDNYSNKIVRKQPSEFEASCEPSILPVPYLYPHHRQMPYDEDMASSVICGITEGHTIKSLCSQPNMPSAGTIGRWRVENIDFDDACRRARAIRAECYHDKIADTAEEELDWKEVPAAKLKFDKLKWLAAVNDPRTFAASKGEKTNTTAQNVIIDTGIRE